MDYEIDKYHEPKWGSSVDVYIQVSFTKILDIDTINQRFQAEAIIETKWHDPNIKSLNETIDGSKIWKPDVYIENGVKDVTEESQYLILPDKKNDNRFLICEIKKVRGLFWENLELHNFPLDVQELNLMIATKKPGSIVNFILLHEGYKHINISNTLDKSMWRMHTLVQTKRDKIERHYSYGKREFPAVQLSAQVFRLPGFFFWNAVLPVFLVTFASLCPFVIDVKLSASRLPSTATMLLTSVNMRWIVGRLLPTVSYLTSLDKYSLASIVIIVAQFLYHAIMGAVLPQLPLNLVFIIDKSVLAVFFALMILEHIIFYIWLVNRRKFRKKIRKNEIIYDDEASEHDEVSLKS